MKVAHVAEEVAGINEMLGAGEGPTCISAQTFTPAGPGIEVKAPTLTA